MKIIFLARRFYPNVGGVEKHVFEICKRLVGKGHEVTVITQSQGNTSNLGGIKIVRIDKTSENSSEKLHIWKWFWKNRELIKEADIIHAHDVFFWYLPSKLLFLGKKCFVTFHGYETYPIKSKAIVIRKISEFLSNGNIIVGDFIKKWYKTKPTFIIYGGVGIPKKEFKPKNPNSAVFFGRLDEHTGVLDYAKTYDLVKKDIPNFDFLIVGDGKFKSRLKKYNMLGFKKDSGLYLNDYNLAFVSRYLSILEALAHKRLVFAIYDNPVKKDYLKLSPFSKYIVIGESPQELAEKINYYLKNPKIADELKKEGYDWVKSQSWENIVKVYLKLWA